MPPHIKFSVDIGQQILFMCNTVGVATEAAAQICQDHSFWFVNTHGSMHQECFDI